MIQFNMLPDVKIQYIRTQRMKHMLLLISTAVIGLMVALVFITFSMTVVQKRHLTNQNNDIERMSNELQNIDELAKILSVQNQLNVLPSLYAERPAADRISGYLDQTTPNGVGLSSLVVDFEAATIEVSGQAPSLELVNNYVDTLKFTTFTAKEGENGESTEPSSAFSEVVLQQFARDEDEATFTIAFKFNPVIFGITRRVELTVPKQVTTRAHVPSSDLFTGSNEQEGEQ